MYKRVSNTYAKFREAYPKQLFDDIIELGMNSRSSILEIGSGTGKATLSFAKMGASLVCVDINQEMLDEAKKNFSKYKNVSYVCSSFEDAKLPNKAFDLIFAAQSWHWINPKIGYAKVIRLLKDDGVFVVIWKLQDDKSVIVREMEKIYKRYYKNYSRQGNKKRKSPEHVINEVSKIKELEILAIKKYKAKINYTRNELIGLTGTYSWVAGLRNKELLFRALHDLLKKRREPIAIPYNYDLIMIKKVNR